VQAAWHSKKKKKKKVLKKKRQGIFLLACLFERLGFFILGVFVS